MSDLKVNDFSAISNGIHLKGFSYQEPYTWTGLLFLPGKKNEFLTHFWEPHFSQTPKNLEISFFKQALRKRKQNETVPVGNIVE